MTQREVHVAGVLQARRYIERILIYIIHVSKITSKNKVVNPGKLCYSFLCRDVKKDNKMPDVVLNVLFFVGTIMKKREGGKI